MESSYPGRGRGRGRGLSRTRGRSRGGQEVEPLGNLNASQDAEVAHSHRPRGPQFLPQGAGSAGPLHMERRARAPERRDASEPALAAPAQNDRPMNSDGLQVADFESRMRDLILSNGVPAQKQPAGEQAHSPAGPLEADHHPHQTPVKSPTTRKRPTQAERKRGISNRLDLAGLHSEPTQPEIFTPTHLGSSSTQWNAYPSFQPSRPYHSPPGLSPEPSFPQAALNSPPLTSPLTSPHHHHERFQLASLQGYPQEGHSQMSHRDAHPGGLAATSSRGLHSFSFQEGNQMPLYQKLHGLPDEFGPLHRRPRPSNRHLFDPERSGITISSPPQSQAGYLEELVQIQIPKVKASDEEMAAKQSVRKALTDLIVEAFRQHDDTLDIDSQSIRLEVFGSVGSGFTTCNSDMDLMLVYSEQDENSSRHASVPRLVERALLDAGYGARLLTKTRVPIIRFCELPPHGILQKLREERVKWEEQRIHLESNETTANGASQDEAQGEDEEAQDEATREEPRSPQALVTSTDVTQSGPTSPQSKRKTRAEREGQEVKKGTEKMKEPPYKTDEERIRLYELAIKEDWYDSDERRIVYAYRDAYKKSNGRLEDEALIEARKALDGISDVLSRYREPHKRNQELEYPKEGVGVLCDINFFTGKNSNPLGIHNTRLQRCYSLFDWRIRYMVLFVKAWAKARKINKPYTGTLSSYGYVMMVLHYVVNIANPPLAPNLQLEHMRNFETDCHLTAPTTCGEYDIKFWQDEDAIKFAVETMPPQFKNQESLGSLLAGFFRYYSVYTYKGVRGFRWAEDVVSLRTLGGLISKQQKGWTGAVSQEKEGEDAQAKGVTITNRYLVALEDPFEHTHNIARPVTFAGLNVIRNEFRRANQMIISNGIFDGREQDFFEEGVEAEHRVRYFGPNPKYRKHQKTASNPPAGEETQKSAEKVEKRTGEQAVKVVSVDQGTQNEAHKPTAPRSGGRGSKAVVDKVADSKVGGSKPPAHQEVKKTPQRRRRPQKPKQGEPGEATVNSSK